MNQSQPFEKRRKRGETHITKIASPILRLPIPKSTQINQKLEIYLGHNLLRPIFVHLLWFSVNEDGERSSSVCGYDSDADFCWVDDGGFARGGGG